MDHVNGDRADNRWCNLREATQSQNQANTSMRADNISGYKGVCWHSFAEAAVSAGAYFFTRHRRPKAASSAAFRQGRKIGASSLGSRRSARRIGRSVSRSAAIVSGIAKGERMRVF
jgi:HNH endonuclease